MSTKNIKATLWQLQWIGLTTLVRREWVRMYKLHTQVFLPPVITTFLYLVIFGTIMTQRIGSIQGSSYTSFIAPGLIIMTVISNAYMNVSSSMFLLRFQKSIEELLVSPMHPGIILLGFCIGGILRGLVVALLVMMVFGFFDTIPWMQLPQIMLIIILVATLFSLAGFTNGILARSFDDIAIVPTFVLTPLSYLGGVFYTTSMLSPFWQQLTYFNPVFYMVNVLRQVMTGHQEVNPWFALSVIVGLITVFVVTNMILLKKGTGLRE